MRDVHVHVAAHVKVSWKAYSVLDTVENGTHFPLDVTGSYIMLLKGNGTRAARK